MMDKTLLERRRYVITGRYQVVEQIFADPGISFGLQQVYSSFGPDGQRKVLEHNTAFDLSKSTSSLRCHAESEYRPVHTHCQLQTGRVINRDRPYLAISHSSSLRRLPEALGPRCQGAEATGNPCPASTPGWLGGKFESPICIAFGSEPLFDELSDSVDRSSRRCSQESNCF